MSPTMTPLPPIAELLPHAAPMILLDGVSHADAGQLDAHVTIGAHSLFNSGSGVGAWVGIEYMAQAIAAWAGYQGRQQGQPAKVGFLLGARRYQCSVPEFSNAMQLRVTARLLLQADNGLGSFDCAIIDAQTQQELAQATVSVFQPHDAKQYLEESMA